MFKSVTYTGFEDRPDLRARAEAAMPYLTEEITRMREHVRVEWEPGANATAPLVLTLTLDLPSDRASARHSILSDDWSDAGRLADRLRKVWQQVLRRSIDNSLKKLDAVNETSAEVA